MKLLLRSAALVVSMTGCFLDHRDSGDTGPGPGGGGGSGGSGGTEPPPVVHGAQTMSDVHVDQTGEQVWIIHSSVADVSASAKVLTAHFGVYLPAENAFHEVLDTTGTLGKKIVFPARDRVLLVTRRGDQDVFVTIDTTLRRPLEQKTYPGDRRDFQLSPSGRAMVAVAVDGLHVLDTANLVDQRMPGVSGFGHAAWAAGEDVLYAITPGTGPTSSVQLLRFDLRTADLGQPIAAPEVITTVPGLGFAVAVSPDGRFAAVVVIASGVDLALVELATGATVHVPTAAYPAFTSDNRAIVWQGGPGGTLALRLVDPATGAGTQPVATGFTVLPTSLPLRRRNMMVALTDSFDDEPGFLYDITSGVRTPMSRNLSATSSFERSAELWVWDEPDDALARVDLSTGRVADVVAAVVDSVDYRAAADEVVIGTFAHSVHRLSMATGREVGPPVVLADPNDVAAPFTLAPN